MVMKVKWAILEQEFVSEPLYAVLAEEFGPAQARSGGNSWSVSITKNQVPKLLAIFFEFDVAEHQLKWSHDRLNDYFNNNHACIFIDIFYDPPLKSLLKELAPTDWDMWEADDR